MTEQQDDRVPTEKWRALPERVDPTDLVETVERDPQVQEIGVTNLGSEFIRIDHG